MATDGVFGLLTRSFLHGIVVPLPKENVTFVPARVRGPYFWKTLPFERTPQLTIEQQ